MYILLIQYPYKLRASVYKRWYIYRHWHYDYSEYHIYRYRDLFKLVLIEVSFHFSQSQKIHRVLNSHIQLRLLSSIICLYFYSQKHPQTCLIVSRAAFLISLIFQQYRNGLRDELKKNRVDVNAQVRAREGVTDPEIARIDRSIPCGK